MVLAQLLGVDRQLLTLIEAVRTELITEFFVAVTALGSVTVAGILIVGLWIYGERRTAVLSAVGVVLSGGTTKALKMVIARARPDESMNLLLYGADSYAFPSGHATLAFVMATVLAGTTQRTAARLYLYTLAVLVSLSRVYLGVHYITDIIGGAVIGTAAGFLVVRYREQILSPVEQYL